MFRKYSRTIAAVVLCFFTWTSGGVFSIANAAQVEAGKAKTHRQEKKPEGAEEKFSKVTGEMEEILSDQKEDIEAKKGRLLAKEAEVEALDADIRKQFAETEKRLKDAKLPAEILERHRKFVKHYDDNLAELKGNIERVEKAKDKKEAEAEIEKARKHLEKVKAPSRHQPLDPNNLPHRQPKVQKREPRLKKEEFERDLKKDKNTWRNEKRIMVASAGSLAGLLTSSMVNAVTPPTAADLAETVDVQLTPEIKAKALELGNNPVKIYEWVRNNIEFVPTWGSIQGAHMTLLTKQGNSFDISSLQISLLRAAGIHARYVMGTVELPIDKVMNWVGGFTDPMAALDFMSSGGTPVKAVVEGGKITKVQMEHVWVEAWINYFPSRGAKHKQGQGDTWIPLDGSFKQYSHTPGIDLSTAAPIASTSFLDAALATATVNEAESYVTGLNCGPIREAISQHREKTAQYIGQNAPDTPIGEFLGTDDTIKEEFPYLLGTLPYTVAVTGVKASEIPDSLRYQITFSLTDPNGISLNLTKSLPELAGRKITLDYKPATQGDADTIASFSTQLPAYLINMRPELRIDGVVAAGGNVTGLGQPGTLAISILEPDGNNDIVPIRVAAGEYFAVAIDSGWVPQVQLKILKDTLDGTRQKLAALDLSQVGKDAVIGDSLHAAALSYFAQLDSIGRIRAKTSAVAATRLPSIAYASAQLSVTTAYGTPLAVTGNGLSLEVPRKVTAVQALDGNHDRQRQTVFTAGMDAAVLSQTLAAELFPSPGKPLGPVLALQSAKDAGIPIYTVNRANLNTVLSHLQLSDNLKSDLTNAVNSGKSAIVTGLPVTVSGWSGTPVVIVDPATADTAWLLGDDVRGALLHPAWESAAVGLVLGDGPLTAQHAGTAASIVAQPLTDGLFAVANGIDTLNAGMPVAYLEQLTSSQFYRIVTGGLGCYLTETLPDVLPPTPSGSCMGSFLETLCIPGDSLSLSTPNKLPVTVAGADISAIVGTAVPLDGSLSSDPDHDPLTYHWAFADRPDASYAVIANSDKANASFIPDRPGSYKLRLVVSDGTAFSEPAFVTVTASYVMVPVPNVVGDEQGSAEAKIAAAKMTVGAIATSPSATVPIGSVISQTPLADSSAPKGSPLDLVVSSGPEIDKVAPHLDVQFDRDPPVYGAGEEVMVAVTATDESGSVSVTLTVDGNPVALVSCIARFTTAAFTAGTTHTLLATAVDPSGNQTIKSIPFGITKPADTTPPEVMILSPEEGKELTGPAAIVGTVKDEHLLQYTLAYSPSGEGRFTTFASGTAQVTNATLGTFDPTTLKNGVYDIRLSATDVNGLRSTIIVPYLVTGNQKVGLFSLTFTDLDIPISGIPVTVNRTYDSRDKKSGDFGIGWNLDLNTITIRPNRSIGEAGWQSMKNPGTFNPTYRLIANLPRFVTVTFGDGRTETFDIAPPQRNGDPNFWPAPTLVPREGTTSKLEIVGGDQTLILNGENLYNSDYSIYNPSAYQLTTKDGTVYQLSVKEGLKSLREPGGNTLTVTSAGVNHSAGVSLTFVRDTSGRISRIIRPDGVILKYDYDSTGNLSAYTDAGGNTTRYSYTGNSNLTDIVSPLGRRYVRNEYDSAGRLVATIDPQGKRIEYTHNTNSREEIVRDRNGNITIYEYDNTGNVTATTDPQGNRTTASYDAQGNKTGETDPLGNTTAWSYDAQRNVLSEAKTIDGKAVATRYTYNNLGKVLTVTDPMGRVTTNSYDTAGRLLTTKDPLGKITSYTYDSRGNLLTTTDPMGNVTTNSYDALGRKLTETTVAGTTTYSYDKSGNKTSETDAKGNITKYAYDPNGKLLAVTDALGNVTSYEYDANGNKTAEADPLGNRTSYAYDSGNRLILTTYADGTTTATSYDNEGNVASRTDQQGRTTRSSYNAKKQLTRTDYSDGTFTEIDYDKAGRQTTSTDATGKTATTAYDSLGRVTTKTDAEGNATTFDYDLNGNQTKQTDANGHATLFEYDANNRLTKTTLPGVQATLTAYDAAGRKTGETDAVGNSTSFAYDSLGRLATVTDALNQVTSYEYDANGNRTAIIDAKGHRTTFAFDALNRVTTKTMSNGGIESYTYDAAGKQTAKTDAKGQTVRYAYDNLGRLTTCNYPYSSTVSFAYTPSGKRSSVTDSRGITAYAYDTRNRLTQVTVPDGKSISYSYDPNGRINSITSFAGTITYNYSDNGRLTSVTDPAGKSSTYTYDQAGNRTGLQYPNGANVTYSYDSNNRLANLNHSATVGQIAAYTYTLGPIGNRIKIDEASGISRQYEYDKLYRLTKEQVADPASVQTYTNDFSYDVVGNRQNKTKTLVAAPVISTDYSYNSADQLVSENGVTYTYDLNGSLASKTDGSGTTTYAYDYDNRMIRVTSPTGTTTYAYDVDGNRVESATATATVKYLVDTNRGLSQVMAEYKPDGALIASYTYADDLISMTRGGQTYWYHFDGLGSTRMLTDSSGTVTDKYDYDAFGNLIARTGTTENPFLYTGQQFDANTGFYHLRARYYQPSTGRFTAVDPWAGDPYTPTSLHKYLYTSNDPVNNFDPSGMMEFSLSGLSATISTYSIMASIAFPRVTALMTTALRMLAPIEVQSPEFDAAAGMTARHLLSQAQELKVLRRLYDLNGGYAGLGNKFENWIGEVLKLTKSNRRVKDGIDYVSGMGLKDSAIIDFEQGRMILEVKLTAAQVLRKVNQIKQFAMYASNQRLLTYIFLHKPSAGEMNEIERIAKEAAPELENVIFQYIIP